MFNLRISSLFIMLLLLPCTMAAQNTLFDIIYCLNGGENKSVGISKLPIPNPVEKTGWNLVFTDEFQSDTLNPNHWNRCTPWDDGDGACHRNFSDNPANTLAENGYARLYNSVDSYLPGCPYSYGAIKTMSVRDSAFKCFYFYAPGYLETRVKLFTSTGQGAACWLWAVGTPQNAGGPGPWNEIDLFEINGVNSNIFTGTYHWTSDSTHVSQNHSIYLTDSGQLYDLGANWTTFGLEWDTTSIKWFVNNTLVKELDLSLVPPFCIKAPRYKLPLSPFCIRFNAGYNTVGNQSGVPLPSEFPQSMLVDYVRAYKKSGQKASPIIIDDGLQQICATAVSPETSGKIIRARYYPEAVYEWSSPAFSLQKVFAPIAQPPEQMRIWIKPGITPGVSYPVFLKTSFPWNYIEFDTVFIQISADAPGIPADNFTAAQHDSLCSFSVTTPAQSPWQRFEFSPDNGTTWVAGTFGMVMGTNVCSFGSFKPLQDVSFAIREKNGCGYSPVRNASLTMPVAPAGCKWPEGINPGPGKKPEDKPVSLSPNPVTDLLEVRFTPGLIHQENIRLVIHDMQGRTVFEKTTISADQKIDLQHLAPGIYYIRVITANGDNIHATFIKN